MTEIDSKLDELNSIIDDLNSNADSFKNWINFEHKFTLENIEYEAQEYIKKLKLIKQVREKLSETNYISEKNFYTIMDNLLTAKLHKSFNPTEPFETYEQLDDYWYPIGFETYEDKAISIIDRNNGYCYDYGISNVDELIKYIKKLIYQGHDYKFLLERIDD